MTLLRRSILSLSARTEFIVVVVVALGYFVIESLLRLLGVNGAPYFVPLSLRTLVVCEVSLLTVTGAFLHLRGWRLDDFGERPSVIQLLLGIPLAVAAYVPYFIIWSVMMRPSDNSLAGGTPVSLEGLAGGKVLASAVVNSVFEEVLTVGYVMTAVGRRFGVWTTVHASVFIRLAYHAHQGIAALASILPLGYVFSVWYARRRSLLPLIAAHAILDTVALSLSQIS